ncbi:hypothetical protein [Microbacterium sp. YJN-G]|nr:hypothetical protein [Microbacterium sp. YJN-G]
MTVPIEIGRWIHDPENYIPERFILEHGIEVGIRGNPTPSDAKS